MVDLSSSFFACLPEGLSDKNHLIHLEIQWGFCGNQVIDPLETLPSGNFNVAMERSTIFDGKTHYFYGHFQ